MTANEATLLLAQHTPEGQDGKVNAAEEADQDFALWQIGAFCGKQLLQLISCTLTRTLWPDKLSRYLVSKRGYLFDMGNS